MKIPAFIVMVFSLLLFIPANAVADERNCFLFSLAIEMLADSQHRTADFAGAREVTLMCIQHDESLRELETAKTFYERCMPYLHNLGTPESKQIIQVYDNAMTDIESSMKEIGLDIETYCATRETCTGDTQTLKDTIEYHIHEVSKARKAGNTISSYFILNNILEPSAGELAEDYANKCMVQTSLDNVRKIRATMPNC